MRLSTAATDEANIVLESFLQGRVTRWRQHGAL
jgi:hypothetical protein